MFVVERFGNSPRFAELINSVNSVKDTCINAILISVLMSMLLCQLCVIVKCVNSCDRWKDNFDVTVYVCVNYWAHGCRKRFKVSRLQCCKTNPMKFSFSFFR